MIGIRNKAYLKAFGANFKKLRLSKKLSQEDLANDADIPINQVGRIERGEVNATISTTFALSKALEVPMETLFMFDSDSQKK